MQFTVDEFIELVEGYTDDSGQVDIEQLRGHLQNEENRLEAEEEEEARREAES